MLIKSKFSIKSKGVCAERKIHDSFNFLFSCIILSTRFTRIWEMALCYIVRIIESLKIDTVMDFRNQAPIVFLDETQRG